MSKLTYARTMSTTFKDLKTAKTALRQEMRKKIATLIQEDKVAQSKAVTEKILKSDAYSRAVSLSIYLHMDDEIKTLDILKHSFEKGKTIYIPRYFMGGNHMEMVRLYDMKDYENLPVTKWNIKQPKDDEQRPEALDVKSLDLILVPGMAFTSSGFRLGRGKGYYDAYLAKAKSLGLKPKTIALAFNEQVLTEIPTDNHDMSIDEVIYPLS